MDMLKNYWNSLEQRERLVLGWGAFIVVVIVLYTFIWQPWRYSLSFMEQSVRQMRVDSVWMRQQADLVRNGGVSSRRDGAKGNNQSLLSIIQQTARQAQVDKSIQQMVPNQEGDEVRVTLESVDFNRWVGWVDNLYKNYAVDISQLNAEKEDDAPNKAEVRVIFIR